MKISNVLERLTAGLSSLLIVASLTAPTAVLADRSHDDDHNTETITTPVATPAGGLYNDAVNVSLNLDTNAQCTLYDLNQSHGLKYAPGTEISLEGVSGKTKTYNLSAISYKDHDCRGTRSETLRETYVIDRSNPLVTLNHKSPKAIYGTTEVPVEINFSDDYQPETIAHHHDHSDFHNVLATLNDEPIENGSKTSHEGANTLVVRDLAGNVTTVNFVIDTVAPEAPVLTLPIVDSANMAYLHAPENKLRFGWSAVGALDEKIKYGFELGMVGDGCDTQVGQTVWSDELGYDYDGLKEGVYCLRLIAEDEVGNRSAWSEYYQITVDNSAPVVDKIYATDDATEADVTGTEVTINEPTSFTGLAHDEWLSEENLGGLAGYQWEADDDNVIFDNPNDATTLITTLIPGTYEITLTVTDQAGNVSEARSFTLVSNIAAEEDEEVQGTDSVVLTPTGTSGSGSVVTTSYAGTNDTDKEVKGDDSNNGEVKSGVTDENENDDVKTKGIPYFGFLVLLLMVLFGLYLLYQQKPEWFNWIWGGGAAGKKK